MSDPLTHSQFSTLSNVIYANVRKINLLFYRDKHDAPSKNKKHDKLIFCKPVNIENMDTASSSAGQTWILRRKLNRCIETERELPEG